ncbi:3-dehydroquinate synthase [Liquorilactobacillus capillatus]|uniref:3-dehydroquinate synthase n=1 Tax=Liquorilactobacillus capillatus DSM 19910 TaxID=1423731 RepID=A0A0R1LZ70_9LACO|nr:3-dehydroquinate synthase [Liquorilactobacillus capillatus]KRL00911.1 3-dehydroquinate synthase [Liquorilactobacillus capillatus DSM 19910]
MIEENNEIILKNYRIKIQTGLLHQLEEFIKPLWSQRQVALITDDNVGPLYAATVEKQLNKMNYKVVVLTIPAGEASKSWRQVQRVIELLAQNNFVRSDGIIALGGGVVGDLAGFIASIYMRGISLIQIPTSLLAQVDSSVGGKTAIDLPAGKNMVGTFYQPDLVLIDSTTIKTLPKRMLVEGYGEIVKCAALVGGRFWAIVQRVNEPEDIIRQAEKLIYASVSFKAGVVQQDEKETGLRKLLNFGHTFGHAVELLEDGRLMHGEAVAIGMVHVMAVFEQKGMTVSGTTAAISERLERVGLPLDAPELGTPAFYRAIQHDKKIRGDQLTLVYVKKIGEPAFFPLKTAELKNWLGAAI